ncbi:hypothetical protein PoB_004246100 [Plakobranchus ocellatus]|uniref:Uncharacterized protein n=1 Tax=Plakobranchus ocellatus TaxID=259542 RepID=A0AAV4AXX5_9GAST|nr:hypothetical protein PoB_004246100 [Plakobranchus ocellatus]
MQSQAFRPPVKPMARLEPATEGSLHISVRVCYPLCHRRSQPLVESDSLEKEDTRSWRNQLLLYDNVGKSTRAANFPVSMTAGAKWIRTQRRNLKRYSDLHYNKKRAVTGCSTYE